jgi:hypothetical protein
MSNLRPKSPEIDIEPGIYARVDGALHIAQRVIQQHFVIAHMHARQTSEATVEWRDMPRRRTLYFSTPTSFKRSANATACTFFANGKVTSPACTTYS